MDWALLPGWVPYLAAAALMLLLAGALAWLDFASRTHRVFIALLAMRAMTMILHVLKGISSDVVEESYFLRLIPYFQLPVALLALYFVMLYPKPLWWAKRRWSAWVTIALIALVEVAYLVRHDLVYTIGPADATTPPFLAAGPRMAFVSFGPLFIAMIQPFAFSLVALALALEWLRAPPEKPWYSGFLVYGGFVLNALFDGTLQLISAYRLVESGAPFPWLPWGWAFVVLPGLSLLPALLSLGIVVAHGTRAAGRVRGHAFRLAAVGPVAILSALAVSFAGPQFIDGPLAQLVLGIWRLALPALVTYALLRHQLFDLDVKVKIALRASTIAVAFLAVFFTVSEVFSNLIQETVGTVLGIAAAVVLAFALRPVERFAEQLAHKIMPGTHAIAEMQPSEKELFYREQVELAMQDGNMGAKERAMLEKLRARLGLTPEEVARAERAAMPGAPA